MITIEVFGEGFIQRKGIPMKLKLKCQEDESVWFWYHPKSNGWYVLVKDMRFPNAP